MNIDLRCSRTSARARRTSRSLERAASTGKQLVPLSAVPRQPSCPCSRPSTTPTASARSRSRATSPPGHSQSEALAFVADARERRSPRATAIVLSGQSSQFSDAMTSLLFALDRRHPRRVHGARVAVQLVPPPGHGAHASCRCRSPARCSRSSSSHKTLNVFSMIGLLAPDGDREEELDHPGRLRQRGPRHEENLDARPRCCMPGPIRLRPILMTAVATMMAAVPSALGLGPGAETRGPMADAVIGGLILSTALCLLVVPGVLRRRRWNRADLGASEGRERGAGGAGASAGSGVDGPMPESLPHGRLDPSPPGHHRGPLAPLRYAAVLVFQCDRLKRTATIELLPCTEEGTPEPALLFVLREVSSSRAVTHELWPGGARDSARRLAPGADSAGKGVQGEVHRGVLSIRPRTSFHRERRVRRTRRRLGLERGGGLASARRRGREDARVYGVHPVQRRQRHERRRDRAEVGRA